VAEYVAEFILHRVEIKAFYILAFREVNILDHIEPLLGILAPLVDF
jgi:hypothetical protein